MHEDAEACLRAVRGRDARFDGWFVTAVTSTGIYCRPSCPAVTPRAENVRFYPSAAAAQRSGFRACRRCRPDAAPGSPAWDPRADVVARAVRLVADGVVDREGVEGLAARLGYGSRQLGRLVTAELGAGPLALARAQRARTARVLVESTDLPLADVAHAAGFASVRQFNATVQEVYAATPGDLRRRAGAGTGKGTGSGTGARTDGPLDLRLPFRAPLEPGNLFGHLAATAVPGVEEWRDGAYRRTLRLPHGHGVVALRPAGDHVAARVRLSDLRDLPSVVARCRRLLDLDADPVAVDDALAEDPVLAPLVRAVPGRRVPRTVDAEELAVRAVLGQQVSTAAARTHAARLVLAHGEPVDDPEGGLTHLFPTASALADLDPLALALPGARRAALLALVRALASGELVLDGGADRERARAQLLALPGIGPWTAETVAMRGLGDPDAFLPTDLGVAAAAARLRLPATPAAPRARSRAWTPPPAYATQHPCAVPDHPVNSLPR